MKLSRAVVLIAVALVVGFAMAPTANANNFSFTGNFTQDDNVQFFSVTVGVTSNVTFRTWSYAGGVNAAGQTIASDGFDPILAVFDSTGLLIGQNDDGGCGLVAADPETGQCYDTYFTASLGPGTYTVSVMQYNNFANGPNLSNGFSQQGQGNFTGPDFCGTTGPFWDVTCDQNDGHWAFDALNVGNVTTTPEPASLALLGSGVLGLVGVLRRKLKM